MSCSETSIEPTDVRRRIAVEDQAAGADHVGTARDACSRAPCAARSSSSAAAPPHPAPRRGGARCGGSARARRSPARARRPRSWSPCRPPRSPTRPAPGRRRWSRGCGRCPRRRPRSPRATGGSVCRWRSLSRTEPMSSEWAASTVPSAEPRMSSVEPPPMSRTSSGSGSGGRSRIVPAKLVRASSSPTRTSAFTPTRSRMPAEELLDVVGVAGGRRGAEADLGDVELAHLLHVALDGREHPLQRRLGDVAGAVDALAETDHLHLAYDVAAGAGRHVEVGHEQPQRVGAAVEGGDAGHEVSAVRSTVDAGTARPPLTQLVEHLVAQRVHAATLGQRLRGEHVQALDPVGHATGGDARDLRHVADLGLDLGPRGEVGLVRPPVGRGQLGVLGEALGHLAHQARGLERPDPRGRARAGQVEGRRERRAVVQARLGA